MSESNALPAAPPAPADVQPALIEPAPAPLPGVAAKPKKPAAPAKKSAKAPSKAAAQIAAAAAPPAAGAEPNSAPAPSPAPASDRDALLARIAELEAKVATQEAQGVAGPPRNWRVSVLHAPTWVVLATDRANAWEEYRKASGLISTQYQPVISESNEPLGEVKKAA